MPHSDKVTFPVGTGGLAASWAEPETTAQAKVRQVVVSRRNELRWFIFTIEGIGELIFRFLIGDGVSGGREGAACE